MTEPSFIDTVRLRSGMYIGRNDSLGVTHLFEFLMNLVLEAQPAQVRVSLDGRRLAIETDAVLEADRHIAQLESGTLERPDDNTWELLTVSALSSDFSFDVVAEAGWASWRGVRGRGAPATGTSAPTRPGSRFGVEVDAEIFKHHGFIPQRLEARLRDLAALRPGLLVEFDDRRSGLSLRARCPRGLEDALVYRGIEVLRAGETTWEDVRVRFAIGNGRNETRTNGFVNTVPVNQGSHIRALNAAITRSGLDCEHPDAVIQLDLPRKGLTFQGPTKEVLGMPELERGVRKALLEVLR